MQGDAGERRTENRVRRWLHRLQLVADTTAPFRLRIAAVKALRAQLPDGNPLKGYSPEALLKTVKRPWETREDGTPVWRPQPTRLDDLW